MVKECSVILNNEYVTVIKYGDKEVQLPAIHKQADKVYVVCENGKYYIVDKDYKPASVTEQIPLKKGKSKKTTVKESIKNEVDEVSANEEENA